MTRRIPSRSPQALTGSQFAESVSKMDSQQREQAILGELLEGNLPDFLRSSGPCRTQVSNWPGTTLTATIFVMPDYLAIGSDKDFLRIPMNLHTATAIAARFGFVLPTRKMVDAIYDQSGVSLHAGAPTGRSPNEVHRVLSDSQRDDRETVSGARHSAWGRWFPATRRMSSSPIDWPRDRAGLRFTAGIAPTGAPIQPLSTVHGAGYADYSHGIRLVSEMAIIDGKLRSMDDILQDSVLAKVLSDEGAIRILPEVIVASRGARPPWNTTRPGSCRAAAFAYSRVLQHRKLR